MEDPKSTMRQKLEVALAATEEPAPRKAGRPRKMPLSYAEQICKLARSGVPRWVAAKCAGVGASTWRKWSVAARRAQRMIDNGEEPLPWEVEALDFFHALDIAEAHAVGEASAAVLKIDPKFYLTHSPAGRAASEERGERGWGEGWGKVERTELTGKDGAPLAVESKSLTMQLQAIVSHLSPAAARELIDASRALTVDGASLLDVPDDSEADRMLALAAAAVDDDDA